MEIASQEFLNNLRLPSIGLALVWEIVPVIGTPLYFTNHDKSLTVDNITYQTTSSFSGSAVAQSEGMAVDNLSISALTSDEIPEEDIISGVYDQASITIKLVQWTHLSAGSMIMKKGFFGEITSAGSSFEVEVRGLTERMQRNQGRTYQLECDAQLGDSRCKRDLTSFTHTGTITAVKDARTFRIDTTLADTYLQYGLFTATSGVNQGRSIEILGNYSSGTETWITTLEKLPFTPLVGDTVSVVAGCDKLRPTCIAKFNNLLHYRGFPDMPVEEVASATPNAK